jgi:tetratricopeptide (TPR) repeat protein
LENSFTVLGIDSETNEPEIKQAYRALARRWHPDRFTEGPERLWAEQKMIQINIAYHEALMSRAGKYPVQYDKDNPETHMLEDIRKLMELGQLSAARQALIRIAYRNAEWNYLFGAVLLRLGEYEKAVLYFGIAARQRPQNHQYRTARLSAEVIRDHKNRDKPFSGLRARLKSISNIIG